MIPGNFGPVATFVPQHTQGNVLCCLCGTAIPPNPANMCAACIRAQVDITEGIQKQATVLYCKQCGRYLQPPKHWLKATYESKELLAYCIKRIKGLNKVKLVDAGFIYTDPSNRRLRVKLTVQGEVLNGAILQQSFVAEYVVEYHMCPDCTRMAANPNSWVACVQVRQHVAHKRTFFLLEQLILKHGADASCVNIKDIHEGVDFFFGNRAHACKFIDFLQSVVPIRYRHDKQLVSHNEHTATYNYKYTFSVEIVPVCKDDLLFLPPKLFAGLSNVGPLVLCTRVATALTYMDPVTMRQAVCEGSVYWRSPLRPLLSSRQLTQFMVLDIEQLPKTNGNSGRLALAEAQVARMSDLGSNDRTYLIRTHLGNILHPGDTALGYDLSTANFVDEELEKHMQKGYTLPDVILVRKSYEEKRRARMAKGVKRTWKLKRMAVDTDDSAGGTGRRGGVGGNDEVDMERFLEELEEDPALRSRVALYKDEAAVHQAAARQNRMVDEGEYEDSEEDVLDVPLDELLDELEALTMGGEEEEAQEGEHTQHVDMEE